MFILGLSFHCIYSVGYGFGHSLVPLSGFGTQVDLTGCFTSHATVGFFIKRAKPDFDCRTYGFTKMSQLLEAFPEKYDVKKYVVKNVKSNF